MSSTTDRIPKVRGVELAWELLAILSPFCERIELAGSIRRGRADVGDVELVCLPRFEPAPTDLFGDPIGHGANLLDRECDRLVKEGVFTKRLDRLKRPRWGSGTKWATFRGVALDLYPVIAPAQWGVAFLIRTGSAAFAKRLVTATQHGGWMPDGRWIASGALWRWKVPGVEGEIIPTPEEPDVFAEMGLAYVPPERRELASWP